MKHPRADRRRAGRRLSRPPRARLSRRLHALAGAVAQAAGARSAGRVQSVALRLVCDRELEIENFVAARILVAGRDARDAARRHASRRASSAPTARRSSGSTSARAREAEAFKRGARDARPSRVASVEAKPAQAQPAAALHHLDAAAGGEPQARLRAGAHHADRAAALRRHRHRRRDRRPHHLYAHRRRRDRAGGDRRDAPA